MILPCCPLLLLAAQPDLFEIRHSDGSLLARSPTLLPGDWKAEGEFSDFALSGVPYRAVILRNVPVLDYEDSVKVPMRVTVIFAASVLRMRDQLWDLGMSVGGIGLVLLLIVSAVAAWGVRRGLEPLRELAAQAARYPCINWDFRPPCRCVIGYGVFR